MEELKCPKCGLINSTNLEQCTCGYFFEKNQNNSAGNNINNKNKISFFKKNQVGVIIFFILLIIRFIWIQSEENSKTINQVKTINQTKTTYQINKIPNEDTNKTVTKLLEESKIKFTPEYKISIEDSNKTVTELLEEGKITLTPEYEKYLTNKKEAGDRAEKQVLNSFGIHNEVLATLGYAFNNTIIGSISKAVDNSALDPFDLGDWKPSMKESVIGGVLTIIGDSPFALILTLLIQLILNSKLFTNAFPRKD